MPEDAFEPATLAVLSMLAAKVKQGLATGRREAKAFEQTDFREGDGSNRRWKALQTAAIVA